MNCTYNKNGHKASDGSVPVLVGGGFTNKNTVEYEVSKTKLYTLCCNPQITY